MIDWSFIEAREGKKLSGYVPDPTTSKSGVTVGVGVDIGHLTDEEFTSLPVDVQDRIEPYRHLTGLLALQKLHSLPLTLSEEEVDTLDQIIFNEQSTELIGDYDRAGGHWDRLRDQAQTVMMSVAFQYGNLASKCPNFWRECIAGNWTAAVANLRNFGDAYPERRHLEADLLSQIL